MSGGHFDYVQYRIDDAAETLERYIARCEKGDADAYGNKPEHTERTLAKFRECERTLRRAYAMLHRVDYLISGDDSEASFFKRWDEEVPSTEVLK